MPSNSHSQPLDIPSDSEDSGHTTRETPNDHLNRFPSPEDEMQNQVDDMNNEAQISDLVIIYEDPLRPPATPEHTHPLPKSKAPMTKYEKCKQRNRKVRERWVEKKKQAAREIKGSEGEENMSGSENSRGKRKQVGDSSTQKRKKAKRRQEVSDYDLDDDSKANEEAPKRFPVYIFIKGSKPLAAPAARSKAASSTPPPLVIQKGPFFHNVASSFSNLQHSIAHHTPCHPDLLALSSFTWRYDKPANSTRMQLTTEVGYKALIHSVRKRKAETVIFVYMKPLAKDVGWPTRDPKQVDDPFDFDEVAAAQVPEGLGQKDQIVAISFKTAQHEAKLTEMYMVGAHPSWPDKRVWVDPGHSTQLVANVRCDIQATGETNYTRPPTPNHFNDDKRLCEPQCPAPPADIQPATQPLPRTAAPPMWPQQQYMWPPYQQFPPPYTFPPQAYLHQQLPQQPGHGPYPPNQYAHAAPILAGPPSTHSSLGLVAHHNISLVNFCSCYKISNIDQRKLVELEYEPGEKLIKSLDEKDWKGMGFSVMGWKHFVVAYRQFHKDLKTGVFNPTIS